MKFNSTAFNRSILCLLITLVFLFHTAGKIEIPLIKKIEHNVYDLRLKLNMPSTFDPRIVIIDIDEKSLAQEGRWPWPRDKLSLLTDFLFEYYQVSVLGFDIVFAEPDTSSGLNLLDNLYHNDLADNKQFKEVVTALRPQLFFDKSFATSLKDNPAVLGYFFNRNVEETNPSSSLPLPVTSQQVFPDLNLIKVKGFSANLTELQNAAIYGGYLTNDTVDSDGSFRRLPLVTNYNGNIYETLSLAMYRRLLEQPPLNFTFGQGYGDQSRLEAINIESLTIPVNDNAIALVPYRGKQGSFNYISATDILNAEVNIEDLKGKIAIVGATAPGLLDLRTTPVQNIYPGVEVHANLLSGMLDQSFKSKPTFMVAVELIELFLLAALVIFLYPRLSSTSAAVIFSLLIASMLWMNIYTWNELHIDNFLATPLILLFILFSVQIYFGYFLETKKKNKLGKIFGQYIPAELVADMSHSEHEFSLESKSKQMTVLFSDVRGFTTISENRSPDELSELINQILTPITKVIHHNHGTIDKYIGDAVMAFWGAPLEDKNHAYNAVLTALNFAPVLDQINTDFLQKGWPKINVGIGINSGTMNVGNMGSEFRMAYTVMGDAVNLGARLEGLTKQYGVQILVSEFTKSATPEFAYLTIDRVKVKGKNEPVSIFEPLCLLSEVTVEMEQMITQSHTAYAFYLDKQWDNAKSTLLDLKRKYPEKLVFQIYLDRIDEYKESPPSDDWDGVFTHISK